MVSFPPCKINLGLNVTAKRPDGFHDIQTCFYPVAWNDVLEVVPASDFSFTISGDPVPGPSASNLCVRAYDLLQKEYGLPPVAIHLLKCIPIGAGLGGGSADGAYTLKALNQIFKLAISADDLKTLAARLGSDCPFFIEACPVIGTGKGDILSAVALSLKGNFLVIVKPEVHVATSAAYGGVDVARPAIDLRTVLEQSPIDEWRHLLKNSFEDHLFKQFPVIEAIQQKLYAFGAAYASMSGSGSAVYGIFKEHTDLKKEFEGFAYWSGFFD
jgi:4-diphosphocytidyl-2-C-methyl-D-erythritol kinase